MFGFVVYVALNNFNFSSLDFVWFLLFTFYFMLFGLVISCFGCLHGFCCLAFDVGLFFWCLYVWELGCLIVLFSLCVLLWFVPFVFVCLLSYCAHDCLFLVGDWFLFGVFIVVCFTVCFDLLFGVLDVGLGVWSVWVRWFGCGVCIWFCYCCVCLIACLFGLF